MFTLNPILYDLRQLDEQPRALSRIYSESKVTDDNHHLGRELIRNEIRATEWLLSKHFSELEDSADQKTLLALESMTLDLASTDIVTRRKVVDAMVSNVTLVDERPIVKLTATVR